MADDLLMPNRALVKIAFKTLEEEGIADWLKYQLKTELFKLDLVGSDPDVIAREVQSARSQALQIDWFMNTLKGFCNE